MKRAPEFLSPKKAAEFIGLDVRQLRWRVTRGDIPFTRMPGNGRAMRLFKRSDLEAFRQSLEAGFGLRGERR